jgi:hypothetical protein
MISNQLDSMQSVTIGDYRPSLRARFGPAEITPDIVDDKNAAPQKGQTDAAKNALQSIAVGGVISAIGGVAMSFGGLWAYSIYTVCVKEKPSGMTITDDTKAEYAGATAAMYCEIVSIVFTFLLFISTVLRNVAAWRSIWGWSKSIAPLATTLYREIAIGGCVIAYAWHISSLDNLQPIYEEYAPYISKDHAPHIALLATVVFATIAKSRLHGI